MKKTAIFLVCFVTLSSLSHYLAAQSVKIGIKAGTSIPNLHDDGTNEISAGYKSKVAEDFGIIADISISEKFSIKTGVDYAAQGGIRDEIQPITNIPNEYAQFIPEGTYIYADFKNEASLNYLEVPLMGKMEWGEKLKYYVNAGPYIGFLLKAKQETSGNSLIYFDKGGTMPVSILGQQLPEQSFGATTDVKENIKSTNFGLTGGVGLSYNLTKKSALLLDARAAYGLTSIQENPDNGETKTGGLFFTFGYLYSLK